jgi:hypothetical protein
VGVAEGNTATISAANLDGGGHRDDRSLAADLHGGLEARPGGLQLKGVAALDNNGTFSQKDVNDGNIKFQDDEHRAVVEPPSR